MVLVDDHLAFRDSLRIALLSEGACEVVGEAKAARAATALVEETNPDVLVTDLLLEDTDGISLLRELRRRGSSVPSLVLTRVSQGAFVRDAVSAGALGYALKEDSLADIVNAMNTVASGARWMSPTLSAQVVEARAEPRAGARLLEPLTGREREILFRVLEGFSNRDIARNLCISLKTVETHRFRINRKLGVHSTPELLRIAAHEGLISR